MTSTGILQAAFIALEKQFSSFLATLDGIPDGDLSTWKPAAEQMGGGDMNTFSGLAVHTAEAAAWRIVHQIFGDPYPRDREAEFLATETQAEIHHRFQRLLERFQEYLDDGTSVNLTSLPLTVRIDTPTWTRGDYLMSLIAHTGLHLGHAEIMRQLWLAERASQA